MQHIIEHGTDSQRHHLIIALEQHASVAGSVIHACAVMGTALSLGTSEEQCSLASALLTGGAHCRHGKYSAWESSCESFAEAAERTRI